MLRRLQFGLSIRLEVYKARCLRGENLLDGDCVELHFRHWF